jgi:hypothetical protein
MLADAADASRRSDLRVLTLEPETLRDIAASFVSVAEACGIRERGEAMRASFLGNLAAISAAVAAPRESRGHRDRSAQVGSSTERDGGARAVNGSFTGGGGARPSCRRRTQAGLPNSPAGPSGPGQSKKSPLEECAESKKVFILEWLDPPFDAGHWVPEIERVRTRCISKLLSSTDAVGEEEDLWARRGA